MRVLLVQTGTALLTLLQTPLRAGQLLAKPGVLLTHAVYLSLLLDAFRHEAVHVAPQHRHHLYTAASAVSIVQPISQLNDLSTKV